jgi:hypothetical protein
MESSDQRRSTGPEQDTPGPSGPTPLQNNQAMFDRDELVDAVEEVLRRMRNLDTSSTKSTKTASRRRKATIDEDLLREKNSMDSKDRLEYLVSF